MVDRQVGNQWLASSTRYTPGPADAQCLGDLGGTEALRRQFAHLSDVYRSLPTLIDAPGVCLSNALELVFAKRLTERQTTNADYGSALGFDPHRQSRASRCLRLLSAVAF
jgi:hypothetical protein